MRFSVLRGLVCVAVWFLAGAGRTVGAPLPAPPTSITTLHGESYHSVRILKVKPKGLQIEFRPAGGGLGVSTLPFSNLPPALKQQYAAEIEKAAALEKRQNSNAAA